MLRNRIVMFSDIPEATNPFLLLLIVKAGVSGGMKVILCGMGARLMMRTVAV